eukprot:scaffold53913_cov67-Phaeocystis_antarctica.AAC.4
MHPSSLPPPFPTACPHDASGATAPARFFEPCLPLAHVHTLYAPGVPRRHAVALPNAGQPSQDLVARLRAAESRREEKKHRVKRREEKKTRNVRRAPPGRRLEPKRTVGLLHLASGSSATEVPRGPAGGRST